MAPFDCMVKRRPYDRRPTAVAAICGGSPRQSKAVQGSRWQLTALNKHANGRALPLSSLQRIVYAYHLHSKKAISIGKIV